MKRSLLLALPLLIARVASAQSAVPGAISYQGRVADANGVLIGDTTPVNRKVTLRVYDGATATTPLYAEEQTVTINKGIFSVLMGQGLPVGSEPHPAIAGVFNGAERFLGVTVDDGGPAADPEITPRQQIVSTAYAFRSKAAEVASSVNQQSGESVFNVTHANLSYMNGTLVLNHDHQLHLGGGAGDAHGALFSNSGGVGLYGRGPTPAERKLHFSAPGGTWIDGPLNFGNRTGQHINLWGTTNGIGIQHDTVYLRSSFNFAWHVGGSHSDAQNNAGGGTNLAFLNSGGLTVNTGNIRINGGGRFLGAVDAGVHGVFAGSFGDGHSFGSQDWTTFSRSARHFAWYLGGAFNGGELNGGGGTRLMTLNSGGLSVGQGALNVENGPLNFGNRLGQHVKLWGDNFGLGIQNGTLYNRTGGNFTWYVGGAHDDGDSNAGGGAALSHWNNDRVDFYRRVYITTPGGGGIAPFEVNASTSQFFGNIAEFWKPNSNGAGYDGRQNWSTNVSIRASNAIVAHNFVATSDRRLKVPAGRSDAARDLETLGALEVTNYTMKDPTLDGGRTHKKVIAQQVEKVFPEAVSKVTGVVPDIFRPATAKGGLIAFKEAGGEELKKGETVRLVSKDGEIVSEVTAVRKEGFTVKDAVMDGELFVYGRRVEDLRVVEYEAIAMLNVSATQELSRQVEQQREEICTLREAKASLEKELAAAKEANTLQDTRLIALEKALKIEAPAPATAKKETKVVSRR